ncbi:hypothetical protein VTJ83DRAFT_7212 [Remersonia thermophila]|uniref:Major facilitator superfamily (MFS) profile domain-containing protein n=1 Tax=Remersonia thermophila TaxID=72144 RepID=A0ABR4D323_9PEZI
MALGDSPDTTPRRAEPLEGSAPVPNPSLTDPHTSDDDDDNDDSGHVTDDHAIKSSSVQEEHSSEAHDVEKTTSNRPPSRRSTYTNTIAVPRAQRRGLFGRFAIIPEVERPYDYKTGTKWTITAIVALAAAAAPMGSGIFMPALPSMSVDLGVSETVTNMTISFYMLSMGIFPLWWSSFSETLGRRTIYMVSFTLFTVFSVLSALSVNIGMLVVMRILGGGASASVQAVGAGTIADIWEPAQRGRAMGIFYLGPLVGPLCSPIIGGLLTQRFNWRATMWFLAIYGAVMLVMLLFCLPETLARPPPPPPPPAGMVRGGGNDDGGSSLRRVSTVQSIRIHTRRTAGLLKRYIVDPLSVVLTLRYPPVLVAVYSASAAFFALFVLNISIQSVFSSPPYSFRPIPLGALYLAPSLGYVSASVFGGPWIDRIMAREARKAGRYDADGKLVYLPEDRMRENMWLAAALYPGALVWYGWTADRGIHFMVPSVANFFFGFGSMLVFGAVTTMLTEFMPKRSSAGVAVNNMVRNAFSCVGSLVAQPLIDAMGNGWLCTAVGLFTLVTGNLAIWALRRNAAKWRAQMDRQMGG